MALPRSTLRAIDHPVRRFVLLAVEREGMMSPARFCRRFGASRKIGLTEATFQFQHLARAGLLAEEDPLGDAGAAGAATVVYSVGQAYTPCVRRMIVTLWPRADERQRGRSQLN